jgi:uncharacterized protein (TIGR02444 family)
LQDRFGVDVNVLLFLLFAAHNGRKVQAADMHRIASAVASWNVSVVVPLRSVRRFLRSPPEVVEPDAAEGLRQHIKQVELEAERLQQEGLYRLMRLEELGAWEASPEAAARSNVEAYAAELGTAFDLGLVDAVLAGFRDLERSAGDQCPGS